LWARSDGIENLIMFRFVTDEVSVGDYVLAGGEVAAMVLIDTVVRLVEGVIKEHSLAEESFRRGLLEYPQYTRPAEFEGRKVPEILLNGNHAQIERWRLEQSLAKTLRYRPELLKASRLDPQADSLLKQMRVKGELENG
jgi:tRNA (guanine37-N1)-methyltransferase